MDITLGLDFGTHQSKLCMSYMPNNETIYEFVEFSLADGSKSVLLPSVIQINKDNTIRIGSIDCESCATRAVSPPEKPELPPKPDIVFPEEPDSTYPPRPKRNKQETKPSKNALKKEKLKYKKELREWAYNCHLIEERHREWEDACFLLAEKLKRWKKEVDSIQAKYDAEYEKWEKRKIVYRDLRYFKQAAFTSSIPWDKEEIPADMLSIWYLTYLFLP